MKIDKRTYNRIHQWNLRHWVKLGTCEHCQEPKTTQWANKTGQYLLGIKEDWLELCPACHGKYDKETFGREHPNGRKYRAQNYDPSLQSQPDVADLRTNTLRNLGTQIWLDKYYADKGGYTKYRELCDTRVMKRDIAFHFKVDSRQILNWKYFDYPLK